MRLSALGMHINWQWHIEHEAPVLHALHCCPSLLAPNNTNTNMSAAARDCHIEFTGDTLKMPISDDLMGLNLRMRCIKKGLRWFPEATRP